MYGSSSPPCRIRPLAVLFSLLAAAGGAEKVATGDVKGIAMALTPTPIANMAGRKTSTDLLGSNAQTSRSAARIRAKGIDPKDSALKGKLEALFSADQRTFHAQTKGLSPLQSTQSLQSLTVSKQATLGQPPAEGKASSRAAISRFLGPPEITSVSYHAIPDFHGGPPDSLVHIVTIRGRFPRSGPPEVIVNVIGCREVTWTPANLLYLLVEDEIIGVNGLLPEPWKETQTATVTVRVSGQSSNTVPFEMKRITYPRLYPVPIAGALPHMAGDGGMGLSDSSVNLPGGTRVSTTPDYQGGTGGSGIDVFGAGISLLNGATATASILRAHSYLDAPSYDTPSDSNRSAAIQEQPHDGRLNTKVAWSFAAGESIDYVVQWNLVAPIGHRSLSSMPKPEPCGE